MEDVKKQVRVLQKQALERSEKLVACVRSVLVEENNGITPQVQEAEVLQTYLVSNKQILDEIELWKPVVQSEVDSLMSTQTLCDVTPEEVKQIYESGVHVEQIPSKLLCSRKAGAGRRKARIVGCGNFGTPDDSVSVSTGGLDSVTFRLLMAVASQRNWAVGSTDIKCAFLNAPKRSQAHRVTLVRPPRMLVQLGVVPEHHLWQATGALYGLRESPEDWTQHRNSKMRAMTWMLHDRVLHLEQTAEANLWAICADQEVLGFVGTYVDDIVTVGDGEVVESALDVFAKTWECSPKEVLSQEGQQLKFCGFQVRRLCNGYHLHQQDYIRDLCERRGISGGHSAHGSLVTVQEEPDENYSIESLRQAQQVIGEIQWLSTRSRPDITYSVGLLSRFMHRRPGMVVNQANNILKYLADTAEKGLVYEQCCSEDIFGAEGELKFPRGLHHVEAHADASYAPSLENYRSVQGTVVSVAGCPVIWSSTRQPMVTQSTAEAELISYVEVQQQAETLASLLEVMGIDGVQRVLYGDNKSAIGLCGGDVGAWRTRHLRLRASGLRESMTRPNAEWMAHHVPGEWLCADGLTKGLCGQAFARFVQSLGMGDSRKPQVRQCQLPELSSEELEELRKYFLCLLYGILIWAEPFRIADEVPDADEAQLVGLGLMACGAALIIRWDRAHEPSPPQASRDPKPEKKRWDREHEPSPPRMSRDPEPGMEEKESKFRAQNEPTWTKSQESFKSGRENEPPPTNPQYQLPLPPWHPSGGFASVLFHVWDKSSVQPWQW